MQQLHNIVAENILQACYESTLPLQPFWWPTVRVSDLQLLQALLQPPSSTIFMSYFYVAIQEILRSWGTETSAYTLCSPPYAKDAPTWRYITAPRECY